MNLMKMKMKVKIISMVQFVLDIDWMTTKEFCAEYSIPRPYFTGDIKSSADQFRKLDVIKHKMFVEYAKLLNKNITTEILQKNMAFESVDVRGGNPQFKNGKYTITNDEFGFWLEPYDSVDGCRISKIEDFVNYGLTYNDQ